MDKSSPSAYDIETWSSTASSGMEKECEVPDGRIIRVGAEAESKDRQGSIRGPTRLLFGTFFCEDGDVRWEVLVCW